MTQSPPEADELRKYILTARMNVKYHGYMERRFASRDSAVMIISALVGGGALAGTSVGPPTTQSTASSVVDSLREIAPGSVQVLLLIITGINLVAATLQWGKRALLHAELRRDWIDLRFALERILGKLGRQEILAAGEFEQLEERQRQISLREPAAPDRKLLAACQQEVRQEVGLDRRPKAVALEAPKVAPTEKSMAEEASNERK